MDNNMEGFFKKQLNRFDEPFDDWEKPNTDDWDLIVSKVPMFNQQYFWTWSNIGLIGLSAILMTSLVYVWILREDISVLEKTIEVQQVQIEEVQQSIQIVEQNYTKREKTIETKNKILVQQNQLLNNITKEQKQVLTNFSTVLDNLTTSNSPNISWNKTRLNLSKTLQNTIPMVNIDDEIKTNIHPLIPKNTNDLSLAKVEKEINNLLENQENAIIESTNTLIGKTKGNEVVSNEWKLLSTPKFEVFTQNSTFFKPNFLTLNQNKALKKQKKSIFNLSNINLKRIEIGYEYRFQAMKIASTLNISEFATTTKEYWSKEGLIRLHGLTLGIPLKNNWSIQTGVRFSNGDLHYNQEAVSIYDSADEYILPDGTIAQSLNIEQKTPFSRTNTTVQLIFDENNRPVDNEEFEWETYGEQDQRTVQIPLGINYEVGIKKWCLLAGVGLQWNRIELGAVDYRMDFDNQDQKFQTLTSDSETVSYINDLNYFSTFATTGFQYQFTKKWSVKATVSYNYHFWNNKTIDNWENSEQSANIGFGYTF